MKGSRFKKLLWGVLIVGGIITVYQFASVWLEFRLLCPSEQQFVRAISPDGEQAAYFSVKYEDLHPWWPANPKPHFYITVRDAKSGKVLLRETDFDWPKTKLYRSTGDSFTNLTRTCAPWAESYFQSEIINSTSSSP